MHWAKLSYVPTVALADLGNPLSLTDPRLTSRSLSGFSLARLAVVIDLA